MEINDDTIFINHGVKGNEECFGFVVTHFDATPIVTMVLGKSGTTYSGAGVLKGALKVRRLIWSLGDNIKNEVHIVPVSWLSNILLSAFPDALS